MKVKLIFVAVLLTVSFAPNVAHAKVRPIVESFTFTPNEVELISANTTVAFELVVSHPGGIKNLNTKVNLSGPNGSTLATTLYRTDAPLNLLLSKVRFRGSLTIPQNIAIGAYTIIVDEVNNNPSAGYEYGTGTIMPDKLRDLVGAESALLVRNSGDLNLNYDTFVGPTHNTSLGISYNNTSVYNNNNPPIWKVGEIYNPSNYYELRVPSLSLIVSSLSPDICSTDGKLLKLIATGNCTFQVYTPRTADYIRKESTQNVTIATARIKPELIMGTISNQTSKNLPKIIEIFRVYSPTGVYVLPRSTTPTVCIASGFYVQIVGGGTCTLSYQSEANTNYLSSDQYTISFEVTRDPQVITFNPIANTNLSAKTITLSATTSSGASVVFSTSTPEICSISATTLNLLRAGNCEVTATQGGTAIFAPAKASVNLVITAAPVVDNKTITCVKGKNKKKIIGVSPKCPKNYKLLKF